MIQHEAIGDARAAIVSHDVEAVEPERTHYLDHIERHRSRGVWKMLGICWRLAAVAITAQVGNHQRKILGEARCDLVPDDVILRISMKQQHRRSSAALNQRDFRSRSFDALVREAFEHCASSVGLRSVNARTMRLRAGRPSRAIPHRARVARWLRLLPSRTPEPQA